MADIAKVDVRTEASSIPLPAGPDRGPAIPGGVPVFNGHVSRSVTGVLTEQAASPQVATHAPDPARFGDVRRGHVRAQPRSAVQPDE